MYFILYKITNLINNKFYIGVHQTNDVDDGYIGSGKALQAAYKKYGVDNFKKEIIQYCSNAEEMYLIEKEIVQPFYKNNKSYNLMEGGKGGFNYINDLGQNGTLKGVEIRKTLFTDPEWYDSWKNKQKQGCKDHTATISKDEFHRRGVQANKTAKLKNGVYSFEGKAHSEETKSIIGKKNSINQKGDKNSRYGTMWITNGVASKSVSKDIVIPDGWYKGRKIK
jgi:hypothetical protein